MGRFLILLTMMSSSFLVQNAMASGSHRQEKAEEVSVGLNGYCPVAYHKMGKAVKGTSQYSATHEGVTYHFVKEMARDLFVKNPEKFLPAEGGNCAVCRVNSGKTVKGDPKIFSVYEGKLYLFPSKNQKKAFDKSPTKFVPAKKASKKEGHHSGSHNHNH